MQAAAIMASFVYHAATRPSLCRGSPSQEPAKPKEEKKPEAAAAAGGR